ncbi:hypothetical protein ACRALDRAFT_2088639, partial [Sodiomyces alcalophilus JCM 7366]|uniref:uncharacterized protein n=1 Tax=Sodiomyces alcalophilus JCM 7366 TaxID=591952 RepID=UPI0039B48EA1
GDNAKWGFAVYRTTYGDDVGWERVKRVIQETAIAPLRENGEHGLIDSLDYVLMDDRDKFDGMSRPALREHFKAWAPAAFVRDGNPHYAHAIRRYPTFQVDSRYTYLIEIDEESLRSIADARLTREWGGPAGHFNFVDSRWKLEGPEVYTSEAERITAELDRRLMQPIDGCTDEDVGWMKVTVRRLGFEFQMMANTYLFDSWYPYYRRPP